MYFSSGNKLVSTGSGAGWRSVQKWVQDQDQLTLMHILTESLALAWAQIDLPALWASSTHAAVSSSEK